MNRSSAIPGLSQPKAFSPAYYFEDENGKVEVTTLCKRYAHFSTGLGGGDLRNVQTFTVGVAGTLSSTDDTAATSISLTEFHCQFVAGVIFWTTDGYGAEKTGRCDLRVDEYAA